jgi:hypothetical protein
MGVPRFLGSPGLPGRRTPRTALIILSSSLLSEIARKESALLTPLQCGARQADMKFYFHLSASQGVCCPCSISIGLFFLVDGYGIRGSSASTALLVSSSFGYSREFRKPLRRVQPRTRFSRSFNLPSALLRPPCCRRLESTSSHRSYM